MNYSRVIIGGRITRDVELKTLNDGTAVAGFSVAVNGYKKEDVSFFEMSAFGKTAENIAKFFKKGNNILVDGTLKQETWEKDGQKRSKTKIVVDRFDFVDKQESAQQEEVKF